MANVFIDEVLSLPQNSLPLDRAMSRGSMVIDGNVRIMVIASHLDDQLLLVRAGIFFSSVIAGCNCADDPTPIDTIEEYTEIEFSIALTDASTSLQIID